uniref:RNA polymerase II associated protein 1 n=1 Tax=Petromyzon marinus TaxID=7757 RepID=S4RLV8_PETMA
RMLARPKPGESEEDLLRFQREFLAAGATPAVSVLKRADKRKGGEAGGAGSQGAAGRDVVSPQALPEMAPQLDSVPLKKSRFRVEMSERAAAMDMDEGPEGDAEARMNRRDTHITAVLSHIVEWDTSRIPINAPQIPDGPFPKALHRSEIPTKPTGLPGKRSLFAQQYAAKKGTSTSKSAQSCTAPPRPDTTAAAEQSKIMSTIAGKRGGGRGLVTGTGLAVGCAEAEAEKIHKENVERLKAMSREEIAEERSRLLAQIDPKLVAFLRSTSARRDSTGRHQAKRVRFVEPGDNVKAARMQVAPADTITEKGTGESSESLVTDSDMDTEEEDKTSTLDGLPIKPQKEWMHMDKVESEKMEWMRELPKPSPKRRKTKQEMQARFDFHGQLVPPDSDVPSYLGLHHHGAEPERAGYSLEELFHLCRSQVIQQRTLALQLLARILMRARQGEFAGELRVSLLRTLMDAGLVFLLRYALDDSAEGVIAAAVLSLQALLSCPAEEEALDQVFSWYQGSSSFPLAPTEEEEDADGDEDEDSDGEAKSAEEGEESVKRKAKDEKKPDPLVARHDIIKGLLKTGMLRRLRYIVEVVRPVPAVVLAVLHILTRIARHSAHAASQIVECPRLVESLVSEFLPTAWQPTGGPVGVVYGLPLAAAMKLARVLCQAGRNMSAIMVNKFDLRSRVTRFVAEKPQDLLLDLHEAQLLSVEALRLWAVAASYGQMCSLYRELYPVLVQQVQALPGDAAQPHGPHGLHGPHERALSLQRAEALVSLLTAVTHSASLGLPQPASPTEEKAGEEVPAPLVSWEQVAGLAPITEGCLRRCLQEAASCSAAGEGARTLASALLLHLSAHHTGKAQQPSTDPVEHLEELERLSEETLCPLLVSPSLSSMLSKLKVCSALCNPNSCSPDPESMRSLVSLACAGGKPPLSLAGSRSPFPFLTAVLLVLNSAASIHKGLTAKFAVLLESAALQEYLAASCDGAASITHASAWLLRHEHHLLFLTLELARMAVSFSEAARRVAPLCHMVALALVGRLLPGSEHLAQQLLSGILFNPDFTPEGRVGGPEAADLEAMLSLKEDRGPEPLGSQGGEVQGGGELLTAAWKDLAGIRACYLALLLGGEEKALERSQARYLGQTKHIASLLLPPMQGPLYPADWAFLPLVRLYQASADASAVPVDPRAASVAALRWLLLLETWRHGALAGISAAAKLCRLTCVFLADDGSLFLDPPVRAGLAALLGLYCRPRALDALRLDGPVAGVPAFYDLYVELLEQFEAASFGDALFGAFVLLPLQRRFDVRLKLVLFGEHEGALRSLGVPIKQFPVGLGRYTEPAETHVGLLRLYFRMLVTGSLRTAWCPVLYAVALHHVNAFIFSQEHGDHDILKMKKRMLRQINALQDKVLRSHLLLYKLPNASDNLGFDLYEQLPPIRHKWLQSNGGKLH